MEHISTIKKENILNSMRNLSTEGKLLKIMNMSYPECIDYFRVHEIITNKYLYHAMKKVDRESFLLEKYKDQAVRNSPIPILSEQTNSAPGVVYNFLKLLDPQPGETILDIGSGSGRTSTLLLEAVGKTGSVSAIERIEKVYKFGKDNINNFYNGTIPSNLSLLYGDGFLGIQDPKKFDKILISAAFDSDVYSLECLINQLQVGGKLLVPVYMTEKEISSGMYYGPTKPCYLNIITKLEEQEKPKISIRKESGYVFVPMLPGLS